MCAMLIFMHMEIFLGSLDVSPRSLYVSRSSSDGVSHRSTNGVSRHSSDAGSTAVERQILYSIESQSKCHNYYFYIIVMCMVYAY